MRISTYRPSLAASRAADAPVPPFVSSHGALARVDPLPAPPTTTTTTTTTTTRVQTRAVARTQVSVSPLSVSATIEERIAAMLSCAGALRSLHVEVASLRVAGAQA
ncbi:MAG: hypothetical protein ACI9KE_002546 [Polyangiales bacterium]|jgi:hypothetical protein